MNGENSTMGFDYNVISQDHSTTSTLVNSYNDIAKEVPSKEQ